MFFPKVISIFPELLHMKQLMDYIKIQGAQIAVLQMISADGYVPILVSYTHIHSPIGYETDLQVLKNHICVFSKNVTNCFDPLKAFEVIGERMQCGVWHIGIYLDRALQLALYRCTKVVISVLMDYPQIHANGFSVDAIT